MVNIMMGPEGSGKTKLLINAINNSVKHETGSMVCIENGNALRFDVDHRQRQAECLWWQRQHRQPRLERRD